MNYKNAIELAKVRYKFFPKIRDRVIAKILKRIDKSKHKKEIRK